MAVAYVQHACVVRLDRRESRVHAMSPALFGQAARQARARGNRGN
jgi:hypothetical protein